MANNNDGQIVLGLDIPKTVSQINDDIKKLQGQLDQVKATGALDTSATVKQINAQIATLQAQLNNINIQANVNMNNSTKTSAQQTGQQIGKLISDSAEQAISRVSSPAIGRYFKIDPSTSNQFRTEMEKLVSEWTNAKGKLTDINIQTRTSYDKDAEKNITRLHQATVTYKNELDEVIKKTIAWRQIGTTTNAKGEEQVLRGFVEVAGQYSKSIDTITAKTDTFVDKQKKAVGSLTSTLASIKSGYDDKNASKPIKLQSNIDKLEEQYAKVETAIKAVGQANKSTFTDAEVEANRLISELRDMVKEYRNAENVSTKMKGTDFTSGLSIAKNDLEKFKADAKDFPQITQTIKDLDTAIGKVGDASSLNKFNDELRVARSELAKIKSETSATNKTEKVGINTSGLQSKIADLQKISPEIDKFETEINGAKVTVQSLLTDLSKINTQGDFSVVNAKFNAFTKAAEASGIAIRDFGNVTDSIAEKVNKIQLSMSTGGYESKVDSLIGKTQQWVDANGNARISTDALQTAMNNLNTAYANITATGGNTVANQQALIEAERALDTEVKKVQSSVTSMNATMAKSTAVDSLRQKVQQFYDINTKSHRTYGAQLRAIMSELASGAEVPITKLRQLSQEFIGIQNSARQAGKLGLSFFDTLKQGISKFSYWTSSTFLVMKTVQSVKEAVNSEKELDKALTNINYTMDVSSDKLADIGEASLSTAKDLKTSAENVLSAVTTYANAKETAESILSKSKPTIMLSNVSGMDTATTTDILQGTINQFDLEDTEESLLHVSDVLQTVSQSMAVDFSKGIKEMAEGIQVSGSVAKDAGYDLESYTALLGNLIEKTRQSGSELGRSLRTMFVRTTKASTSALAGGEVTEDDLSNAESALRRIGIEVRDTKDSFREFDDIMTDLYNKIDDLSEVDLANIAYEVASTRQTAVFKVMVKSWGDYIGLAEKANEASGTTFENQEKYAKSLEAQMLDLSTTMDIAWHNMINEETVTPIISAIAKLAEGFEFLTDKAGLFGTLALGGGLFAGIKNVGQAKMWACLIYAYPC